MWRFRGSKIVYVFPSLGLGSRGFRLVARAVNIMDNYILLYIMYVYKRSQSHFFFVVYMVTNMWPNAGCTIPI